MTLLLRDGFIATTVCWAALIVLAPFLAIRTHASTAGSLLILGVYGIGSLVCHQLRERSFHLWTAQLPVCARCTGIYLGAVLGTLGWTCARVSDRSNAADQTISQWPSSDSSEGRISAARRTGLRSESLRHARLWLAVAAAPTALTLAYEWSTGIMPSNAIRAAAGIPIGVVVAWLVVAAADNQVN